MLGINRLKESNDKDFWLKCRHSLAPQRNIATTKFRLITSHWRSRLQYLRVCIKQKKGPDFSGPSLFAR